MSLLVPRENSSAYLVYPQLFHRLLKVCSNPASNFISISQTKEPPSCHFRRRSAISCPHPVSGTTNCGGEMSEKSPVGRDQCRGVLFMPCSDPARLMSLLILVISSPQMCLTVTGSSLDVSSLLVFPVSLAPLFALSTKEC